MSFFQIEGKELGTYSIQASFLVDFGRIYVKDLMSIYILLLGFAGLGLGMTKLRLPVSPFILAFILAPMLELNLRRGMTYTDEGVMPFFTRPISGLLLLVAVLSIVMPYLMPAIRRWRGNAS